MNEYRTDITIIVMTYNSELEKLKETLASIIQQKGVSYNIIVADDGSSNFDKSAVELFFEEQNFNMYSIIQNEANIGTVENVRNAIKYVKSHYVKLISPGDFFYCKTSLKDILVYMKKNDCSVAFGRSLFYTYNGAITLLNKFAPYNILYYKYREKRLLSKDNNNILKYYIKYLDLISGASTIAETKIVVEYLDKIHKKVHLAEDMILMLMVADGIRIGFFNEAFIYYEYGTGVSTNKKIGKENIVFEDVKRALKIIENTHPELVHYCEYTLQCDGGIKRFIRRIDRKLYIVLFSKFFGKIENYFFLKKHCLHSVDIKKNVKMQVAKLD